MNQRLGPENHIFICSLYLKILKTMPDTRGVKSADFCQKSRRSRNNPQKNKTDKCSLQSQSGWRGSNDPWLQGHKIPRSDLESDPESALESDLQSKALI